MHQYGPGTLQADSRFNFYMFLVEAYIASAVIYACTIFGLFVFFPWGIPQLQSDWRLSCDHGLDYASRCENNNNNNEKGQLSIKSDNFFQGRTLTPAHPDGPHIYIYADI